MQNPLFLHSLYGPSSISVSKLQVANDYISWKRLNLSIIIKRKLDFVNGVFIRSMTDET